MSLALVMLASGCARPERPAPDVILVSLDSLHWPALAEHGGTVQAAKLAAFETSAARFENVASLAPGGAPAAATLLTGETPARHGLRRLGTGTLAADVATLGDRLRARGYATGAFLQADDIPVSMQLDRGFEAWDAAPDSFPAGHPGISSRRALDETVASGLQWMRFVSPRSPAFLWLHLADPASPSAESAERAQRLGELDRMFGAVRMHAQARGERRGCPPIIVLATLRGESDLASATEDAYLLREGALRVRALVEAEGITPATIKALVGLDELSGLIRALTSDGQSRMLDIARGAAATPRTLVVAETLVPMTVIGANPVRVGLRETMMAAATEESIVQAIASDPAWPAAGGRPAASETAATFLAIDSAWSDLQRGHASAAVAAFRSLARDGDAQAPPGARAGLALALLTSGDHASALRTFGLLEAQSAPGELAWEQALLGRAAVLTATGDAVAAQATLTRLVEAQPRDVRALAWLARAAASAGDRKIAVDNLIKILEIDPDHPDALEAAAALYLEAGEAKVAADHLGRALARRPTSSALLLRSARASLAAGDGWTALDRLTHHVEVHGPGLETDLAIAEVYEVTERWQLAAEYLKKALERAPLDVAIMLRAARVQLHRGDEDDARGLLTRVAELRPESAAPCLLLARFLASAGRPGDARGEAAACAAQHPSSEDAAQLARELAGP